MQGVEGEFFEERRCAECANAKLKEIFNSGHQLFICGKHKAAVTDMTLVSSIIGCKGVDFEEKKQK